MSTTSDNSTNLLHVELYLYAHKMNPDTNPNTNRDNSNNLLDTIILLGYKRSDRVVRGVRLQ